VACYGLYTLPRVRDIETIHSEPRLIAAVRRSIREHGGEPASRQVDKLLDERLAHRSETSNADDWSKNMIRARCESRYATSVFSSLGVVVGGLTS